MSNLYIIVEGRRTEPKLFKGWLPSLAPAHHQVSRVEDVKTKNYFMVAGHGYPSYLERIRAGVADIKENSGFSWLLVFVDAEQQSAETKRAELDALIRELECPIPYAVFVADCCVESWLLGNRSMVRKKPQTIELKRHIAFYDISTHDPEIMPCRSDFEVRAQYHQCYLEDVFKEKNMSFSKTHPGHAATTPYLQKLIARSKESSAHLRSFAQVVDFFERLDSDSTK